MMKPGIQEGNLNKFVKEIEVKIKMIDSITIIN